MSGEELFGTQSEGEPFTLNAGNIHEVMENLKKKMQELKDRSHLVLIKIEPSVLKDIRSFIKVQEIGWHMGTPLVVDPNLIKGEVLFQMSDGSVVIMKVADFIKNIILNKKRL